MIYKKDDHPCVVNTLCNLGLTYVNVGEYQKALEIYDKCRKIYITLYQNERHPSVANLYSNIGIVLEKSRKRDQLIEIVH